MMKCGVVGEYVPFASAQKTNDRDASERSEIAGDVLPAEKQASP